jgi:hypothetical protein
MSVSGVPCRDCASGDMDGRGVGRGGAKSGASDAIDIRDVTLLFRAARAAVALLRFGGDFFVGDSGSSATLSGGLKIWLGSTDSLARVVLRATVRRFGVVASPPAVFRLGDRVVRAGAGVKSSSSSSSCCRLTTLFSMSELLSSSTTTFLRVAARREGLSGDAMAITSFQIARDCEISLLYIQPSESSVSCCDFLV